MQGYNGLFWQKADKFPVLSRQLGRLAASFSGLNYSLSATGVSQLWKKHHQQTNQWLEFAFCFHCLALIKGKAVSVQCDLHLRPLGLPGAITYLHAANQFNSWLWFFMRDNPSVDAFLNSNCVCGFKLLAARLNLKVKWFHVARCRWSSVAACLQFSRLRFWGCLPTLKTPWTFNEKACCNLCDWQIVCWFSPALRRLKVHCVFCDMLSLSSWPHNKPQWVMGLGQIKQLD